jgi:hypothetical protein
MGGRKMTVEWTPDMRATLYEMLNERPRPALQTIGERLGVDRSVVARYCQTYNLPTKAGVKQRRRSNAAMILGLAGRRR